MSERPVVRVSDLAATPRGLECSECGCRDFRVKETRPREGGYIYRRRECRHCLNTVTTTERIVGRQ